MMADADVLVSGVMAADVCMLRLIGVLLQLCFKLSGDDRKSGMSVECGH